MKRRTLTLILSLTVITFAYRATGQPPQARVEDVGVPDLRKASKNIVYIPALPMPQGWLEFARLARLNVIYLSDADDARQMQPFRGTILEFISHCAHRFNVAIWWGRHVIVVRSNVDTQRAVSPSEFLDRLPNALRASLVDEQKPWGWCPPKGERMAQMVARVLAERRKGGNADAHLLPLCLGMVSQELWAVLRRYQLLHAGTAILCMDKSHVQADDKKVRLKLSFPTLSPDEPTLPSLHDMTVGYDRFRDFLKRKGAQQPLNEFKRAVYFQALSKPPSNLSDERLRQLVSFSIAGAVPTSIAQKLSALAGIAVTFNGNDGERLWMQVENVPLRDVLEAFMV
ncbi:MAG TPA: hypothetical protein EYP10_12035, partial [Armatimonadetes bacterium]|nr:hypothetical protein [Armatimonadota bacterium]